MTVIDISAKPTKSSLLKLCILLLCFLAGIGVLLVPFIGGRFFSYIIFMGLLGAITALGLNIFFGYCGQPNFGINAFCIIGAFTCVWLQEKIGLTFVVALAISGLINGLVARLLAIPLLRLRGHMLVLGTAAFGIVLSQSGELFPAFFGGEGGISFSPRTGFGKEFETYFYYYFALSLAVASFLFCHFVANSRVGRAMKAIRDDEEASVAMGINIAHYKNRAFMLNAVLAGLSSSLYVQYIAWASTSQFGLASNILYLIMIVIGGLGSNLGSMIGGPFIIFLNEALGTLKNYTPLIYGLILLAILRFLPEGISSFVSGMIKRIYRSGLNPERIQNLYKGEKQIPAMPSVSAVREPTPTGGKKEEDYSERECVLEIGHLSKNFGGLQALRNVSMSIQKGLITGLIGPNGSGKSTLLNLVTGMLKPSGGQVFLERERIDQLAPYQIAGKGITRTFQLVRVFPQMTVLENVMVGRHLRTKSEILTAGFRLGRDRLEEAQSRSDSLEILKRFGFENFADMPVRSLSYGQQKVVELARALATEPKLLLLDEPLSGLNFQEIEMLVNIVKSIVSSEIGVLIVEHNMEVIMSVADKMHVLNFGEKIAEGTPKEIAKDRLVIDAYLGKEFKHVGN